MFEPYDWSDKTTLIVEDDESSVYFFREILAETKTKLLITNNGKDAIEICENNSDIDMILMDIEILGINGLECTKKIKERFPQIPIIAQTAYAFDDDKKKALECGCDDYLTKPIDQAELLQKMDALFNN